MKCSNNLGGICSAVIVGAAIGGILGILYAPAKGCETRRKLSNMPEEADELTDSLKEKLNSMIEEIRRDIETIKNK